MSDVPLVRGDDSVMNIELRLDEHGIVHFSKQVGPDYWPLCDVITRCWPTIFRDTAPQIPTCFWCVAKYRTIIKRKRRL